MCGSKAQVPGHRCCPSLISRLREGHSRDTVAGRHSQRAPICRRKAVENSCDVLHDVYHVGMVATWISIPLAVADRVARIH